MDKRNNNAIPRFLKRFTSPWLLVLALLGITGYRGLHDVFNPPDQNKIFLINESSARTIEFPLQVTMATEKSVWTRKFDYGRTLTYRSVCVLPWDLPYLNADLEIRDGNNSLVARIPLEAPGRYSGVLVIVLSGEEKWSKAYNELPKDFL